MKDMAFELCQEVNIIKEGENMKPYAVHYEKENSGRHSPCTCQRDKTERELTNQ